MDCCFRGDGVIRMGVVNNKFVDLDCSWLSPFCFEEATLLKEIVRTLLGAEGGN
jgi:hypothetical protein